jgi:hypothetical protein
MKSGPLRLVTLAMMTAVLIPFAGMIRAAEAEPPIDPVRGRQLMQKSSRGETLTPEEQAYLERVKQEIRTRSAGKRPGAAPPPLRIEANTNDWSALVPITDLTGLYKGEDGGLYGDGRNEPPEAHRAAHLKESARVRPLDANGQASEDGNIGLISIGFSNTSIEWEAFKRVADADPQKSSRVIIELNPISVPARCRL